MMSASAIDSLLRRRRCRVAAFAVVMALGAAVATHHMPVDNIGADAAMVICLAVLPALALAVAHVVHLAPRTELLLIACEPCRLLAAPPLPRARSSPVATVILRC